MGLSRRERKEMTALKIAEEKNKKRFVQKEKNREVVKMAKVVSITDANNSYSKLTPVFFSEKQDEGEWATLYPDGPQVFLEYWRGLKPFISKK